MKRRTKKIISLVIVLAIVVTTVLSTVVAVFAEDLDDYGYHTAVDYSQVRPEHASIDLKADRNWEGKYLSSAMIPLTGIPDDVSIDDDVTIDNITSSNPDIAFDDIYVSMNELHIAVTGLGSTMFSCTFNGYEISFIVNVTTYDFSNIGLAETSVTKRSTSSWIDFSVELTGVPEGADTSNLPLTDVKNSNKNMEVSVTGVYSGTITFTVDGDGTTTVSFKFNGKDMSLTIHFIHIGIGEPCYRLAKGKTQQLTVKGVTGPVTYESLNPSVATVTADGKVTAIKNGAAVIKVTAPNPDYVAPEPAEDNGDYIDYEDGDYSGDEFDTTDDSIVTFGTVINVGSAKKIKAFNWARRYAAKSKYSQDKRMSKGYYDCSSLVWRAYHSQKINLMRKDWAPTAADLGKYLVEKGKKVGSATEQNYQSGKFQVGDLFFETGADNGRYKGIYHVEMFGGYTFGGFDDYGDPYLVTTYAARGDGYGSDSTSCFLCRP